MRKVKRKKRINEKKTGRFGAVLLILSTTVGNGSTKCLKTSEQTELIRFTRWKGGYIESNGAPQFGFLHCETAVNEPRTICGLMDGFISQ